MWYLDLPPPVVGSNYTATLKEICDQTLFRVAKQQQSIVTNLKFMLGAGPNEIVNEAVTCDCTCSKRGFTAPYGVVVVISWDSGEVLDCEVLSKYCAECALRTTWERTSEEYIQRDDGHKRQCTITYAGSSSAMEAKGALKIW